MPFGCRRVRAQGIILLDWVPDPHKKGKFEGHMHAWAHCKVQRCGATVWM